MSTTKNATEFIASLKQVVDFDEVKSDHAFDRSIMNLSKQLTLSGMPQAFPAIQLMMSAQEDGSNIDHKINLEFKFDSTATWMFRISIISFVNIIISCEFTEFDFQSFDLLHTSFRIIGVRVRFRFPCSCFFIFVFLKSGG